MKRGVVMSLYSISRFRVIMFFCFFLALSGQSAAYAQGTSALFTDAVDAYYTQKPIISVGVHFSPPFTMMDDKGRYTGMAVDLWWNIEKSLGFRSHFFHSSPTSPPPPPAP